MITSVQFMVGLRPPSRGSPRGSPQLEPRSLCLRAIALALLAILIQCETIAQKPAPPSTSAARSNANASAIHVPFKPSVRFGSNGTPSQRTAPTPSDDYADIESYGDSPSAGGAVQTPASVTEGPQVTASGGVTSPARQQGPQPLRRPPTGWNGLNLGNLPIFPFRGARLNHTVAELRRILDDAVRDLADAGGNTLRVWLHIDGSRSPCWRQPGHAEGPVEAQAAAVTGCNDEAVEDLKWLLRRCVRRDVRVLLVLWSHDVLAVRRDNPLANRERALHMIRTSSGTAAYVDNCLTPLVRHLATTPLPPLHDDNGDDSDASPLGGISTGANGDASSLFGSGCGCNAPAAPACSTHPAAEASPGKAPAAALNQPPVLAQSAAPGRPSQPAKPGVHRSTVRVTPTARPAASGAAAGSTNGSTYARQSGANSSTGVAVAGESLPSLQPLGPISTSPAWLIPRLRRRQLLGTSEGNDAQGSQPPPPAPLPGVSAPLPPVPLLAATPDLPPLPHTRSLRASPPGAPTANPFTGTSTDGASLSNAAPPQPSSVPNSTNATSATSVSSGIPPECDPSSFSPHSASYHTTTATSQGGTGGAAGAGAPTYSSVLLGYEVLNEPEGMSWDLRLYHNYMYDMAWGSYTFENPDIFGSRPERAADFRTLQALKTYGGRSSPAKDRTDLLQYEGWYFLGGYRKGTVTSSSASGDSTHSANTAWCLSAGSVLSASMPTAHTIPVTTSQPSPNGSYPLQDPQNQAARFAAVAAVAERAEARPPPPPTTNRQPQTPADITDGARRATCTYKNGTACPEEPPPWYGNSTLAAAWEQAAAVSAATVPAQGSTVTAGQGTWFNRLMYIDVIGHHNSEMPYLLPLASSCRLRTTDVTVPQLQRFVSRLASAIHRADPRAQVTVGVHSMPYCTDVRWLKGSIDEFEERPRNVFSDEALKRAFTLRDGSVGPGWDPSGAGTLDFYSPHGYPDWGNDNSTRLLSPFSMPACGFQLDKPALVGEFWDKVSDNEMLTAQNWAALHGKGGYMGGLGWAMLQVVEAPARGTGGQPGGQQLAAPRRIVHHEKRAVYLSLLRQMSGA